MLKIVITPLDQRQRLRRILAGFLLALASGCASIEQQPLLPERELTRHSYTRIIMGVACRITLFSLDEPSARQAAEATFRRLEHLDRVMSDYRADSELMLLCDSADGAPQPAGPDLVRVLSQATRMAQLTDGAYDPTVGPLVALWREARKSRVLPDEQARIEALALVGHDRIRISPPDQSIALEPGTRVDLGGIGKGFAADECIAVLRKMGVNRCLVDLGGDIVAGDAPPGRGAWEIEFDSGIPGGLVGRVSLANSAIATSGDVNQHIEIDGTRYSHIVDPRTGLGLTHRIAVAVIAPDGATADALASAVSVLGLRRGLAKLEALPDADGMIVAQDEGHLQAESTSGWQWRSGSVDVAPAGGHR